MPVQNDDIVRVTCRMKYDASEDLQNIYYYELQSGGPVDNDDFMADVGDALDNAYTALNQKIVNNVTYESQIFYNLTQDEPMGEIPWEFLQQGTVGTEPLPYQMAAQINFLTGVSKSQGRKYLGGLAEADHTGSGGMTGTMLSTLATFAADLLTEVAVGAATAAIGHYAAGSNTFVEWLSAQVPVVLSTQRRRKPGSGS